jgi:hypothetical protein
VLLSLFWSSSGTLKYFHGHSWQKTNIRKFFKTRQEESCRHGPRPRKHPAVVVGDRPELQGRGGQRGKTKLSGSEISDDQLGRMRVRVVGCGRANLWNMACLITGDCVYSALQAMQGAELVWSKMRRPMDSSANLH